MMRFCSFGALLLGLLVVMGCANGQSISRSPEYLGVTTQLLDGDLVRFMVKARNATKEDALAYSQCAAAQYTLIRGYFFARHLRSQTDRVDGITSADAVYLISADLPTGVSKLDAEIVTAHCAENNIPMV